MYKILKKELLSPKVWLYDIEAPQIAKKAQPGQFLIVRTDEEGERIPLTIADFDRAKGTVSIVFQEVGAGTEVLGQLNEGDDILDVVAPLGKKTHIEKGMGTVVCIGGGIGVAPIYPIARGMHQVGNKVISIMGAKNKEILILEKQMRAVSDEVLVTTDDGSYGIKGFVTNALQQIIDRGEKIDEVIAIGPVVMMRSVVEATRPYKIKTVVSLNPIMVDGTGMCGGCRVQVGDEIKFACVDGPEFDGHLVDFKGLMSRQRMYKDMEKIESDHVCKLSTVKGEL
ncbi:sulfide/dihydroorotate dehydrogenase-like FAD/NAD-binding protein [Pectinatus cerevisiiphilus]|uniref:Sulfide dehydrogenase (Flavoprotein) subunit SudB n=1 Tax=Pectinatus cerevisiiphilus TaxID=86956 RepID=A0A4R3K3L9_9FIRM|nr:sulfide/dihydroorotate dehydrogenase-like FAD/NAD-binding protein [Pectinatus cerevisiiphilus]TCS77247.1 sulfide dehydrogenase (flavoprotein) subunit SudB [Pectinatus cerevisiiphilus]